MQAAAAGAVNAGSVAVPDCSVRVHWTDQNGQTVLNFDGVGFDFGTWIRLNTESVGVFFGRPACGAFQDQADFDPGRARLRRHAGRRRQRSLRIRLGGRARAVGAATGIDASLTPPAP